MSRRQPSISLSLSAASVESQTSGVAASTSHQLKERTSRTVSGNSPKHSWYVLEDFLEDAVDISLVVLEQRDEDDQIKNHLSYRLNVQRHANREGIASNTKKQRTMLSVSALRPHRSGLR